jgi:hypothetical protein
MSLHETLKTLFGTAWHVNSDAILAAMSPAADGVGDAGKPLVLDENKTLTVETESESIHASNSVETFVWKTDMKGVGGVGGRGRFRLDTDVVLGGWANALKAEAVFGANGRVTGLGSAFVAELVASAGFSAGSYAPLEVELGMPAGALTGARMSLMSLNVYGAGAGTFDDNGFLFDLNGVTAGAAHVFASNSKTGIAMTHTLRIKVGDTTLYLAGHTSPNFGGS